MDKTQDPKKTKKPQKKMNFKKIGFQKHPKKATFKIAARFSIPKNYQIMNL